MKATKDMTLTLRLAISRVESEAKQHETKATFSTFSARPKMLTHQSLTKYSTRFKNFLHQQVHHPLAQRIGNLSKLINKDLAPDTLNEIANVLEFAGRQARFDVFGK